MIEKIFGLGLISASIRMATPILLAALGGTFIFSAGVWNIALEGSMLMGSFFAVMMSYLSQYLFIGFLSAGIAGMVLALLLAFLIIKIKTDAIVVGIGGNILAWGITVFVLEEVFNMHGAFTVKEVLSFNKIQISIIDEIPVISQILSGHTFPVYLSWVLCFICWLILYKTPLGLKIRAIGANEEAAKTVGIQVERIQILSFLVSGFLAGLGGAYLSIGYLQAFWGENMTAGRGFIALCALAFGKNNPSLVLIACLLFGFADAIGIRFQVMQWQPSFVLMIPYIITIFILWLSSRERII